MKKLLSTITSLLLFLNIYAYQNTNDILKSNDLTATLILEQAISCADSSDAILVIAVTDGTAPYQYRLNGGDWQDSDTFTDLAAGDYIGEVIDSENSIMETPIFTLNNPLQIEIDVIVHEDTIIINANGGTGQLRYSLDDVIFSNDSIFSGVPNGDYIVSVIDENDCVNTTMTTVAFNSIMTVAILDQDISCNNVNDGQIRAEATGGTPPYQYSLNSGGFQETSIFSNLMEGTYSIRVADSEGFIRESNDIIITNPLRISVDPIVNDDKITVFSDGGTGILSYSIDGINFQESHIFTGLSNGDYTVSAIDENDCLETAPATIGVNNLAVIVDVNNNLTCFNDNDAQIEVFVQGGTPDYVYSLNDSPFQDSPVFSNLGAGEYVAVVMDSEGFRRNSNILTINNPEEIIATISINNNQVTVHASGGIGQLQYSLEGGDFSTNPVFTDLTDGTYDISIRDENNCTKTLTATIGAENLMVVAILVNDITCHNDSNAEIRIEAQGGVSDYMYRLNDGEFQNSPIFSSLESGTYIITVIDGQGTSQNSNTITVTNPDSISIEANTEGDEISIQASGGTGALSYSIDGVNFQDSPIFTGLDNGNYTLSVKDANNCLVSTEEPISVNNIMAVAVLNNELICHNDNHAQIVVQVMGGTQPYQFSLNDGPVQSVNVFNDLGEGVYTVTIFDAEGFSRPTNMIIINNPPEIVAHPVDLGTMITVNASGGTGQLMYSIDGSTFQESDVFSNLPNGTYTITVMDQNACTATFEATVAMNNIMGVAVVSEEISCYNADDARIVVQVSGGTMPYEFSLNGGSYQSINAFDDLGAGSYSVIIRDAQGLVRNTNTIVIENPEEIIVDISLDVNDLTVNASGGVPPYRYSINGEDFQLGPVFPNLRNDTYTVTVMDDTGCIVTGTQTISVNNIMVNAVIDQELMCFGDTTAQIHADATGGSFVFRYKINGRPLQESPTFRNLGAGTYVITVFDDDGFSAESQEVTIESPTKIEVELIPFSNRITVHATGGTGQLTYSIDGETFQQDSVFTNLENDDYTITVMDENACTISANTTVNVIPLSAEIILDNAITCTDTNDGQISIVANGGIPDYQYQLNDGTLQNSSIFSNLEPGIYHVNIFDSEGRMTEVGPISLMNPTNIIALADSEADSLFVQAAGGTGQLMYSIDGENFQTESFFAGLTNGIYTVTIQDENACSFSIENIPVVPISLSLSSMMDNDISCSDFDDGAISIHAIGGIMPYMFSLDGQNFQLDSLFDNLSAGTYTPIVVDALGTTTIANTHTLTHPEVLSFGLGTSNDSIIIFDPSGGTPPYEFSIDDLTFQSEPVFSGLENGDYNVTVRDANDCITSLNIGVLVSDVFNIKNDFEFEVYPNPSHGSFFLKLPQTIQKNWTIQVFDAIGRPVYQTLTQTNTPQFSLKNMPSGTYYLRLWNGSDSAGTLLVVK